MADEAILSRIIALEGRVSALEQAAKAPPPVAPTSEKPQSLREFLLERRPRTYADKALAVAYHLEKRGSMASFNLDDLSDGFAQAKEPLPGNPSDLLYQNARRGYVMEAKEKKDGSKAWTLTNRGEEFVQAGFIRTGEEAAAAPRRPKRKLATPPPPGPIAPAAEQPTTQPTGAPEG